MASQRVGHDLLIKQGIYCPSSPLAPRSLNSLWIYTFFFLLYSLQYFCWRIYMYSTVSSGSRVLDDLPEVQLPLTLRDLKWPSRDCSLPTLLLCGYLSHPVGLVNNTQPSVLWHNMSSSFEQLSLKILLVFYFFTTDCLNWIKSQDKDHRRKAATFCCSCLFALLLFFLFLF